MSGNEEPETCYNCEHLLEELRAFDVRVTEDDQEYFCGHYDVLELDGNEQAPFIGLLPVIPDWCPLKVYKEINTWFNKRREPPIVHYLILRWDKEILRYEVVFYTHDISEFERYTAKYPEKDGYIFALPISWIKSHDIMVRVNAMKEREKQRLNAEIAANLAKNIGIKAQSNG